MFVFFNSYAVEWMKMRLEHVLSSFLLPLTPLLLMMHLFCLLVFASSLLIRERLDKFVTLDGLDRLAALVKSPSLPSYLPPIPISLLLASFGLSFI